MKPKSISILIEVDDEEELHALAQFLKRVGYNTILRHTDGGADTKECDQMINGLEATRRALAQHGYAPR